MIIVDVQQGTPEWEYARLGIPTASAFDKILTPKELKPSKSGGPYRNQLLAEWLLGMPLDFGGAGAFAERGTGMEAEARAYFEFQHDVTVQQVGFIKRDDGMAGCSPDGLIGEDDGLELKCPAIHTMIGYVLNPQLLLDEYRSQVQGSLYITGRERWHLLAYHPNLPAVHHIVTPDEKYQAALGPALDVFVADLLAARQKLAPERFKAAA